MYFSSILENPGFCKILHRIPYYFQKIVEGVAALRPIVLQHPRYSVFIYTHQFHNHISAGREKQQISILRNTKTSHLL